MYKTHKESHGRLFTQEIRTHDIKKLCRLLASYTSEECSTSIHLGVTYLNCETVSMPAHSISHQSAGRGRKCQPRRQSCRRETK